MFEIINPDRKINFTSKFKLTGPISIGLVIVSLFLAFTQLKFGVDFRGGAEIMVRMGPEHNMDDLRDALKEENFQGFSLQRIGPQSDNMFIIKVPAQEGDLNRITDSATQLMAKKFGNQATVEKVDIVGPKAGVDLRNRGIQAMFWALLAIMVYIGLRFDFKYSPGAVVALFHDVSIIIGIFSLTGLEFNLATVGALLMVIGYSVNDTVVIYDRVREHEMKYSGKTLSDHINNAMSETLSRTVLTSGTTLFISLAMFFMGGEALKSFFFAITLGVIIGTYSSLFVAAPVTLILDRGKKQTMKEEGTPETS